MGSCLRCWTQAEYQWRSASRPHHTASLSLIFKTCLWEERAQPSTEEDFLSPSCLRIPRTLRGRHPNLWSAERARHKKKKTHSHESGDAGEPSVSKTSVRIRTRGRAISQINSNPDVRQARGEITSRSRRGDGGEARMSSVQRRHSPKLIYFLLHYMRSVLVSLDSPITRVVLQLSRA